MIPHPKTLGHMLMHPLPFNRDDNQAQTEFEETALNNALAQELHEKSEAARLLRAEQAEAALRCLEILEEEIRVGENILLNEASLRNGKTLLDSLKQVCTEFACNQAVRVAATKARAETAERMRKEFGR